MKKSVYLDATIPSHYFDERTSIKTFIEITKRWWEFERKHYNLFLSEATIAEIQTGIYPKQDQVLKLVQKIDILVLNNDIEDIVEVYVKEFVMPKKKFGDAYHLAIASYYKIDFLLTWNCDHLANANKSKHIASVNLRLGLSIPEIVTPMQLFQEKGK
jgi:predicted nucleic acid-binding protein